MCLWYCYCEYFGSLSRDESCVDLQNDGVGCPRPEPAVLLIVDLARGMSREDVISLAREGFLGVKSSALLLLGTWADSNVWPLLRSTIRVSVEVAQVFHEQRRGSSPSTSFPGPARLKIRLTSLWRAVHGSSLAFGLSTR